MAFFRKKPVVIEAVEVDAVIRLCPSDAMVELLPEWVVRAYVDKTILVSDHCLVVKTLEGTMTGVRGSWLIKGVRGELYCCEGNIFKETYEPEFRD
jgi:hypothetical protein